VQRPRQPVSREEQEHVLTHFFAACTEGNMEGLLSVLAEHAVSWSDGGGKVKAALRPIYGVQKVARFFMHINDWLTPGTQFRFAMVNGLPGLIAIVDGRADFVTSFEISNGKIEVVYSTRNPDKLRHVKV
jgi:RNA polymerase sigma-70 factor (ECF subfamily)